MQQIKPKPRGLTGLELRMWKSCNKYCLEKANEEQKSILAQEFDNIFWKIEYSHNNYKNETSDT